MYQHLWHAALRRYIEREKLRVSDEEHAAITASVERQLTAAPTESAGNALTPEQDRGIRVAWARASLMDWKVCKSLHEKYGGRVGIGSLGAWTAFDGQNALLREHVQAGDIVFHNRELEEAFWNHTRIRNFADAYPEGDNLKRLLSKPPIPQ